MARDEARIFSSVWDDPHFLELTPSQQRLYFFLLSQKDLSWCGVIALRERRWSHKAKNLTVQQIGEDLAALAANPSANPSANPYGNPSPDPSGNPPPGPLIVIDEETEEVFVRSLIRHDGIWKIPNLLKSAREAARLVQSPAIRAALLAGLRRLPLHESDSTQVRAVLADFIADLTPAPYNPSPNPSANPSPNPSANPSPNPSGDPSATPSQGKGEGYGGVVRDSPSPVIPFPVPPTAGTAPPRAPAGITAQTLVGEWIDTCRKRPPSGVIGQIGKHVKAMLDEGIDPDDIRRGLTIWMTRRLAPSHLPNIVNDVMNTPAAPATAPGRTNTPRTSTTDERVAAIQALKNQPPSSGKPHPITLIGELAQ